jgi:molybdopterin converting factor small subunit
VLRNSDLKILGQAIMIVQVIFHGLLSDWTGGASRTEISLPDSATLTDLLLEIRRLCGPHMPPQLREKDRAAFIRSFWCLKGSVRLNDPAAPLTDGDEIQLLLPLAGG